MQPTRAAPAPPGQPGSRRDSGLPASPAQNYPVAGSSSRQYSKSASNSPNPNRYSAGAATGLPALAMTSSNGSSNGAPPPRPTRAGTLPLDHQLGINGSGSAFREPGPPGPPGARPAQTPSSSQFLAQPAPPPLHHQPFSAPGNPYANAAGLDKDFDEKVGLGMGTPMGVVEPREKELPKEPVTMGRNRSGTGKSSKDKKSVFGVLSGKPGTLRCKLQSDARIIDKQYEGAGDFHAI